MSRKKPRGSTREAPILRVCTTCGEKGVAHTRSGQPFQAHLHGRRHREALARRSEPKRAPGPAVEANERHAVKMANGAGQWVKLEMERVAPYVLVETSAGVVETIHREEAAARMVALSQQGWTVATSE